MHELYSAKTKLTLEHDKILQKYQVLLGIKYSLPVGFIGLYFTISTNFITSMAVAFGIILAIVHDQTMQIESELERIKHSIVSLETSIRKNQEPKK